VRFRGDESKAKKVYEGVTPLTGQDIAEVIVFAASRKENVVIADVPPYEMIETDCRFWYSRVIKLVPSLCIVILPSSHSRAGIDRRLQSQMLFI